MFILNTTLRQLEKYTVEMSPGEVTEVTRLANFYLFPDRVANYDFSENVDGEKVAIDDTMVPVHKFVSKITEPHLEGLDNSGYSSAVSFFTDGNENEFSSPNLNAIVNLGPTATFVFYRKGEPDNSSYFDVEHDTLSDDEKRYLEHPEDYFVESANYDDKFILEIDHNELVAYDPKFLHLISESTLYQIIRV